MFYRALAYREPVDYVTPWAQQPWCLWLDSARRDDPRGRYSFLAVEPSQKVVVRGRRVEIREQGQTLIQEGDPLGILEALWRESSGPCHPQMPPFQGGYAGYLGYDLARTLERLPMLAKDDLGLPDAMLGRYEKVLAFDHQTRGCWAFARDARQLEEWVKQLVCTDAPRYQGSALAWQAHFTPETYADAVAQVIAYIWAGDIFQANLSQRMEALWPERGAAFAHYCHLRRVNPAPFAAYFHTEHVTLASSSPERFLWMHEGNVETRPIKGTRPRALDPQRDQEHQKELLSSAKDRAENAMIVDLMRNDLSRVCTDHSVEVPELCGLESFSTVHHLVSTVIGHLRSDATAWSLLRACFPGGSISGAPKIRAMEIIEALEPTRRGPYCGSIGYIGWDGTLDTSITIRTLVYTNQRVYLQVGGGIVADSVPAQEYQETLDKARALLDSFAYEIPRITR